jgi:hypothetical protein
VIAASQPSPRGIAPLFRMMIATAAMRTLSGNIVTMKATLD